MAAVQIRDCWRKQKEVDISLVYKLFFQSKQKKKKKKKKKKTHHQNQTNKQTNKKNPTPPPKKKKKKKTASITSFLTAIVTSWGPFNQFCPVYFHFCCFHNFYYNTYFSLL